ncbi:hypothetical protein SAMN06298216_0513 [Spirosomataceae bacterium TFI 002]|nr:hypothetical protein SAMN06298216_0513 [Spirosomataceae bacterium TFI 002]
MNKTSKLDFEKVLLKDPLFTKYDLQEISEIELLNLLYFLEDVESYNKLKFIDSYCPLCKKDTTFNSEDTERWKLNEMENKGILFQDSSSKGVSEPLMKELGNICVFIRKFNCSRNPEDSTHSQIFLFRVIGSALIKVGQHPTLGDLVNEDLKKYRKISEEIYLELNKAVGLSAHGVGIGSFVYLRRIIEKHIVVPIINSLVTDKKLTIEQVRGEDFKGKIKLAKDSLPDFLVNNGKIYSILSKGIHELEEDLCKEYFPILRTAIEIILDEQIEKLAKEKKNKFISDEIHRIN